MMIFLKRRDKNDVCAAASERGFDVTMSTLVGRRAMYI